MDLVLLADNNTSAADADCLRTNSEAFFDKLDNMEFKVKNATKALLQDTEKYILCLETPEISLMYVLLANTLKKLKEDFPNQCSDLVFTDFNNFIKINEQKNYNFPDILVCEVNMNEQLDEYFEVITSLARLVKEASKNIIFVMKNSKYLDRNIMKTKLVRVLKLEFTELWKKHDDEKDKSDQAGLNNVEVNQAKEESAETLPPQVNISSQPNNDVDFPLHLAASQGKNQRVIALLGAGFLKDLKNKNGLTPLHLAITGKRYTIVRTLLKNNADVNAKDTRGETALLKACNINDEYLIKLLLKSGAEIGTKFRFGNTVLHLASRQGHKAAVTALLKRKSNINAQNNNGLSPLHFAVQKNKEEVVLELLKNGANVHLQDNKRKTPFDYAETNRKSNLKQIMATHVASLAKMQ